MSNKNVTSYPQKKKNLNSVENFKILKSSDFITAWTFQDYAGSI